MSSEIDEPIPDGKDPEEYDKVRRRVCWKMIYGLHVVGSRDGDRRNGMTLNWVTQVSFSPKLVAISVERTAFTNELIKAGRVFSLNLIPREHKEIIRRFTKPVEVTDHQMNGYGFREAVTGAPILDDAIAYLDCTVQEEHEVGDHTLFIGEIADADFIAPEDAEVLRLEDTNMNYGG